MFNPVIFERGGLLLNGDYLLGQHRWSEPVTISEARLICRTPPAGTLTLTLEVGGVLVPATTFTVTAGDADANGEARKFLTLEQAVAAGSFVRWKITFDSTAENAATAASLTMTVDEDD